MNRDYLLRVEGTYPEKLLERALQQGATFARVQRSGGRTILVSADSGSAAILMQLCKRYGLNAKILRHGGWSALRLRAQTRWTLLPGILLCMILSLVFLSRIWIVDIRFTGSNPTLGNADAIRSHIAQEGIFIGMPAAAVDTNRLQAHLTAEAGDFSYIGVRRQGIRLLVELSPEVPSPELYQIEHPRDLVASRDGVVESINVYSGHACVKPGDTVRKGQTLIRGEEYKSKEETTPVGALGEVIARCWHEGNAEGDLQTEVSVSTGQTRVSCCLEMMHFSLPISECESFLQERIETQILPIVGMFLPLEIERSLHLEMKTETVSIPAEQLRKQLLYLAQADALAKLTKEGIDFTPAESWSEATQDQSTLRVRAVYEIYTDIASTRDALT